MFHGLDALRKHPNQVAQWKGQFLERAGGQERRSGPEPGRGRHDKGDHILVEAIGLIQYDHEIPVLDSTTYNRLVFDTDARVSSTG